MKYIHFQLIMLELPTFALMSSRNIIRGRTIAELVTAVVLTSINNTPSQSIDSRCRSHQKGIYVSSAVGAFSVKIVQDQQRRIFQLIHIPHAFKAYQASVMGPCTYVTRDHVYLLQDIQAETKNLLYLLYYSCYISPVLYYLIFFS